MKRTLLFLTLFPATFFSSFSQQGPLDETFNGGIVTTSISTDDEMAHAVAIQPDGKIIVAGSVSFNGAYADFALARYHANGTLDIRFGQSGTQTLGIGESNDVATAVALQTDGKIVVAGYGYSGTDYDFALARFNTDGSLDKNFSHDGKVMTAFGNGNDYATAVAIQPDGKIVAGGYAFNGKNYDFAVARYNINGTPDNSFNNSGNLVIPFGKGDDAANCIVLQPDGKIVVAGYAEMENHSGFAMARLNKNGNIDHSFGTNGFVSANISSGNDIAHAIALFPGGKLILAGEAETPAGSDFALACFDSDGSLDAEFGNQGIVTSAVGAGASSARSLVIQADGKILAGGFFSDGKKSHIALVRYTASGNADETFGTEGKIQTIISRSHDEIQSMALQEDGKLVTAGFSSNGADYDFAVARYFPGLEVCADCADTKTQPSDNNAEPQITLFPNPAINEVEINVQNLVGEGLLKVMNITGQVLLEEKIYLTGSDILPVDLHALPAGIYQVILMHDSAKLTRGFTKQ